MNYFAIVLAAVSAFVIGGLWYSPALFARPWMRASGVSAADLGSGSQTRIFSLAFVFTLIMAFNLAMFLDAPDTTVAWGAAAGALAAVWVVFGIGTVALFERRPAPYTIINGAYWLVSLTLMGTILGAWR